MKTTRFFKYQIKAGVVEINFLCKYWHTDFSDCIQFNKIQNVTQILSIEAKGQVKSLKFCIIRQENAVVINSNNSMCQSNIF